VTVIKEVATRDLTVKATL